MSNQKLEIHNLIFRFIAKFINEDTHYHEIDKYDIQEENKDDLIQALINEDVSVYGVRISFIEYYRSRTQIIGNLLATTLMDMMYFIDNKCQIEYDERFSFHRTRRDNSPSEMIDVIIRQYAVLYLNDMSFDEFCEILKRFV